MAKKISDQARIINLAFAATSREEIDGIIESLHAIKENRFPVEKKTRKARKPREPKVEQVKADAPALPPTVEKPPRTRKLKAVDPEPNAEAIARKCSICPWEGETIHPEPCPECGNKTEAA